ncbi:MAG: hypothetical protein K2Z81_23345 [Cyanobacteria bacterium]|nr:hypothetical protein [Cyanobacteriota bacterium]
MKKSSPHDTLDSAAMRKYRKRFLRIFPDGFYDEHYLLWEHNYKDETRKAWDRLLNKKEYTRLLEKGDTDEIANRALQVESKCKPPFLFSFEKMALRDALHTTQGARLFSDGLNHLLYERGALRERFITWIVSVSELPRKQSRVLSWPILRFFPYIAQPDKHMIMKPRAMQTAAAALGFDLQYSSKPNWTAYERLLLFADLTKTAIKDLEPRHNFDVQTFLWAIGSEEYERIADEMGV